MADNMENHSEGGSATTVLITVIIILIIGAAFYFGFVRGNWGADDNTDGVNVELNLPGGGDGESIAE